MSEIPSLPYLSNEDRLKIYQLIISGCSHLWSKNKLQQDKVVALLQDLYPLTQNDPYFLAHFVAWASKQPSRDLQVVSTYINALSSADGQPFSHGSKYKKPNLRYISSVVLQDLDPKQALRVKQIGSLKWGQNKATHFPTTLTTAFRKYLKYREANLHVVKGIVKTGLGKVYRNLYRSSHLSPSDEVASLLRWGQKDRKIVFAEPEVDFKGLTDLEIAKTIQDKKIGYFGVLEGLSRIKKKMSPVIAVAILEQVTGNQAVILRSMFEEQGVLNDPEVLKLYEKKIREAKTALDRAETVSKTASEQVKALLKKTRSEVRKEVTRGIGRVFLHLDASGSMRPVFDVAVKSATIISECIDNPADNFAWGYFGTRGYTLPIPEEFTEDAFKAVLFGRQADAGSTDVFALYPEARKFGAEVDVIVTDQGHNTSDLELMIRQFHENNPDVSKPKVCVIVDMDDEDTVKNAYEANGIPVAVMKPDTLTESALVVQAIRQAMEGPMAVIDSIMETELPELPKWWFTI